MLEGEEGTTPDAPAEATQAAEQAVNHIQAAATQTAQAAATAPNKASEEMFQQLGVVLTGVERELKRANDLAEASAQKASETVAAPVETAQAAAPDVEIVAPEKPTRTVRRNGRKVTRRG